MASLVFPPIPDISHDSPVAPVVECGGTYSGEKGTIQSPDFPWPYAQGLECKYEITVPDPFVVRLTFDVFDTEEDYDLVKVSYDLISASEPPCWLTTLPK